MASETKIPIQIGIDQTYRDASKFNRLAHADARHDFHHYKVNEILEEIARTPLNSKLSFKQRAQNINETRVSVKNPDIYTFFQDKLNAVLPVSTIPDEIPKELEAMLEVQLKYKDEIITAIQPTSNGKKSRFINLGNKEIEVKKVKKDADKNETFIRNYQVTAVRYRTGKDKIPVSQAFHLVSGKKNEFALIVDAAYISISDLRIQDSGDGNIEVDTSEANPKETKFYFIKSIENDSDSATKIANFEKIPEKGKAADVDIYFLKDEDTVGYFPKFNSAEQAANVFTGVDFETRRIGDKVLGSFQIEGNQKYDINDLSNSSEKKEASILAMNKFVENRNKTGDVDENSKKEIALHILSKRMGDWCQAACLLDKARNYTSENLVFDDKKSKYTLDTKGNISLRDLPNAEIGVLTHDQILLAYSLLLGVNVFFTLNTVAAEGGDGWLLYFKNPLSSEVTKEQIDAEFATINTTIAKLDTYIKETDSQIKTALNEKIAGKEGLVALNNIMNLKEYLSRLYEILYGFSELTPLSTFQDLSNELESLNKDLKSLSDDKDKIKDPKNIELLLSSKIAREKADHLIRENEKQLNLQMPSELNNIIDNILKHVNEGKALPGSIILMQFIEEIIKPFQERYLDIDEVITVREIKEEMILSAKDEKRIGFKQKNIHEIDVKVRSIFSAIKKPVLPKKKKQGGGGKLVFNYAVGSDEYKKQYRKQLITAFDKIRQRQIVFMKTKSNLHTIFKAEKKDSEIKGKIASIVKQIKDDESFIGLKKDYVKDRHGNFISILDKYIVTQDECDIFLNEKQDLCKTLEDLYDVEIETIMKEEKGKAEGDTEEDKYYFFIESYLELRRKLLVLDLLYTQFKKLERIDSEEGDRDFLINKIHNTLKNLNKKYYNNLGKGEVSFRGDSIELHFTNLRDTIFNEYYSPKGYPAEYYFPQRIKSKLTKLSCEKALQKVETDEAALFLLEFADQKDAIIEEEKKLKDEQDKLQADFTGIFGADVDEPVEAKKTEGGARKKRRTRRKSQRIKTTRRKRKNVTDA